MRLENFLQALLRLRGGMDKPFGIDVSRHQGAINWDITVKGDPKVIFVGVRASISWGYQDGFFKRNWEESKRLGLLRAAYHVVYPAESPVRQVDNFLQVVGSDLGELPLVLDLELDHGLPAAAIADCVITCSGLILQKSGRKPMIYSRANWINDYITGGASKTPPSWLDEHDWWLAHYTVDGSEHPGPPPLPRGVSRARCKIHQTSRKGQGKYYGMESYDLDLNRWQGDLADLMQYAGGNAGVEVGLTFGEKVDLLWAHHPELHKKG